MGKGLRCFLIIGELVFSAANIVMRPRNPLRVLQFRRQLERFACPFLRLLRVLAVEILAVQQQQTKALFLRKRLTQFLLCLFEIVHSKSAAREMLSAEHERWSSTRHRSFRINGSPAGSLPTFTTQFIPRLQRKAMEKPWPYGFLGDSKQKTILRSESFPFTTGRGPLILVSLPH